MSTVIKLDNLTIKNFKGIDKFSLKLGGESAVITGENGQGKTRLADAYFWLFTGSTLDQRANYNVLSLDETGNPINKLDAIAKASIWIGSRLATFKKIHRQKWSKKDTFLGCTTDHFIDGEPLSQTEYLAECNKIYDPQVFRALSDPLYFCSKTEMKWRRKILFKLCKAISDDQIIELYDKFKDLRDRIKGTSYKAYRKICTKKKRQLDKRLDELPAMIRALKESSPDISGLNESELRKELEAIDQKILDQKNNIDRIKRQKRIALLESEMIETENKAKKELLNADSIDSKNLQFQYDQNKRELENHQYRLKELESERESLASVWKRIKLKRFEKSNTCFACGQDLPDYMVALQKDKFNEQKASELKAINQDGQKLKAEITALQKIIENLESKNEKLKKSIADSAAAKDDIKTKIETELSMKQQAILKQIADLQREKDAEIDYSLEDQRSKIQSLLLDFTQTEKNNRQIARYEKNQNDTLAELEDIERDLYLLDEFDRLKAEQTEANVSKKFDITNWKLFEMLQNGNTKDICEPLFDGIPFNSDLNTGARVNIGIDCINVLSEHFKLKCPIFVDNSESITDWIETDSQMIRLKATKKGDKLDYEVII